MHAKELHHMSSCDHCAVLLLLLAEHCSHGQRHTVMSQAGTSMLLVSAAAILRSSGTMGCETTLGHFTGIHAGPSLEVTK